MKCLVSPVLASKVHVLLLVADKAKKEGNAKGAAAQYVTAGQILPPGVCVKAWNENGVEFFTAEKEVIKETYAEYIARMEAEGKITWDGCNTDMLYEED